MKIKGLKHIKFFGIFPITIFYYELVFKIFTKGSFNFYNIIFWLLFSLLIGGIDYLLCSAFKNQKANKAITVSLLSVSALIFLIQFFVFKQFGIFYDLTTMTAGAEGAVTVYFKEILALIFSFKGILAILLYALPPVLCGIFLNKRLVAVCSIAYFRLMSGALSLVSLLLALVIIFSSSFLHSVFKSEYNYQNAVSQFGLFTGIYLDIKYSVFPQNDGFAEIDQPTKEPEEEPVDAPVAPLKQNILDIDFEALNENAGSTIVSLNTYVSGLEASYQNEYTGIFKDKNLIFITAEAFSRQVIDPVLTPTLYRLSTKGINFLDYYQNNESGTTGGEYQNLFGLLATSGGKSFKNTKDNLNYFTMGSQLDRLGYYGKAYHNNSYTYYDRHITHINIGYSDGFMGYGNGMEEYVQNKWPQSDYEMIKGTLPTYIDKEKFNIYYMSVSGHNNYTTSSNSMTARHWDRVKDLPYSDTVKGYLAANLDLEDALTHLVSELENKGIANDTVIAIAPDHYPYGLAADNAVSELYGYDATESCFARDSSTLIIWSGCLEDKQPIIVDEPTSSIDILPTLSNLFGTEYDSRFMIGRDVFSDTEALVFYTNYSFKTKYGTYYSSNGEFVPATEDTIVPEDHILNTKNIIKNKIKYCTDSLNSDYLRHVFG